MRCFCGVDVPATHCDDQDCIDKELDQMDRRERLVMALQEVRGHR